MSTLTRTRQDQSEKKLHSRVWSPEAEAQAGVIKMSRFESITVNAPRQTQVAILRGLHAPQQRAMIQRIQQRHGNRYVQGLRMAFLQSHPPTLIGQVRSSRDEINSTGDKPITEYEQEANQTASSVMRTPAVGAHSPFVIEHLQTSAAALMQRQKASVESTAANPVREKLRSLKIDEKQIGAPETLEEKESDSYLRMLEYLQTKHKGVANILIRRWNRRSDDLGIAKDEKEKKTKPYNSVLHYLRELDHLARASLGVSWDKAIPILSSSKYAISLAGARFTVHPRVLYFTAAAQVGIDIAANREAGKGHYIAPGALYSEVYSIYSAVSTIINLSIITQAQGYPSAILPLRNAAVLYNNLRDRLTYIDRVVSAQQKTTLREGAVGSASHDPLAEYHQEPALVTFFAKKEDLRKLPTSVSSDAEAVLLCQKIAETLKLETPQAKPQISKKKSSHLLGAGETLPKKTAGHGTWSFDPHSTSHGLATAIDLFTDRMRAVTNMGVPAAAKPFLNHLIQDHGAVYGLNSKQGYRMMNMAIARLLRDKGKDVLGEIEQASQSADQKLLAKTIYRFDAKRIQLKKALQKRAALINRAVKSKKWRVSEAHRGQLDIVRSYLSSKAIADTVQSSPENLVGKVKAINRLLEEMAAKFPMPKGVPQPSAPIQRIYAQIQATRPEVEPSLKTLVEDLSSMQKQAQTTFLTKKLIGVKRTVSAPVKKWIKTVSNLASAAFDQPLELMTGIASVKGARMMGSHHWEIGAYQVRKDEAKLGTKQIYGFRDLLTSEVSYKDLLLYDMSTRQPDVMERILKTMSESPGGREAIFGEGVDKTFKEALTQWASTQKVNLADLLQKVRAVEPREKRMNPQMRQLITDFYSRGYYALAKRLEIQ